MYTYIHTYRGNKSTMHAKRSMSIHTKMVPMRRRMRKYWANILMRLWGKECENRKRYVCIHTYIHTHVCTHTYICVLYIRVYTYIHTNAFVGKGGPKSKEECIYIHTYTHTYIHTYEVCVQNANVCMLFSLHEFGTRALVYELRFSSDFLLVLPLYVCMYICVYIHVYVCVCVYSYIYGHIYTYISTYTHTHTHMYIHTYILDLTNILIRLLAQE